MLIRPIEFDWVTIPAGPFWMGSDLAQDSVASTSNWARRTERPQHEVVLPSYQISRMLITNEQWAGFVQQSGYHWADKEKGWPAGFPEGKEKYPITWITWFDAQAFCDWAGVRLPTEAEWEKAARGLDKRLYPWGNQSPSPALANYGKQVGQTTPVDHYCAGRSYYGLFDMAGNTWEWTSTIWGHDKNNPEFTYPYQTNDGREDRTRLDVLRVVRSAGWKYTPDLIRCAARDWNRPQVRGSGLSFRVVKSTK